MMDQPLPTVAEDFRVFVESIQDYAIFRLDPSHSHRGFGATDKC